MLREDYYWVQDGNVPNPLIKTHNDAVNKIYDEHEAQMKAKDEEIERLEKVSSDLFIEGLLIEGEQDKKARSIVAMLFWNARKSERQLKEGYKYTSDAQVIDAQCVFIKAYKMLKDNK